jgi:hypothetical protein
MNRRATNVCSAGKHSSRPLEMSIPLIRPWMKESNKLARPRICSGYIWTFVPVAVQTGKGEVIKSSQPSVLACNDVVDVKR